MSTIIGIDLGTTFSAMALVRDGVPQILPHGDERIMPSVVGFTPQGALLVGTPARNQYVLYPERTARSIKRQMGQNVRIPLGERDYTPQEISALVLRELKRSAEEQFGQPVERAVITVPAYFSDAARQATHEAGEIAGFTVERIINEPTAAALAYGLDRTDEHQLVAVYDLGGGTFDVSIIELESGVVEVRSSHGNTQLGGDDFDERLVDFLAERFTEEHEVDPDQIEEKAQDDRHRAHHDDEAPQLGAAAKPGDGGGPQHGVERRVVPDRSDVIRRLQRVGLFKVGVLQEVAAHLRHEKRDAEEHEEEHHHRLQIVQHLQQKRPPLSTFVRCCPVQQAQPRHPLTSQAMRYR